ncbi:adenine deaminase [Candidatus Hodarchaeum mangrovi]
MNLKELKNLISCSRGEIPSDFLLRNGTLVNVITRELYKADISIYHNYIANIAAPEELNPSNTKQVLDISGKFISPGFIETHLHIESTMLPPIEFTKAVIPHGTTTVLLDPHEIGNALGIMGLNFLVDQTNNLPLRFLIEIPSCVPAAPGLETSGFTIDSNDIEKLIEEKRGFFGLGEVMNYPGVLYKNEEVLRKVILGKKLQIIDGHSPGVSGTDLDAYIAAGIESDHESTTSKEFLEKIRKGMHVLIREGSLTKDLRNILGGLNNLDFDMRNCTLCSDDRNIIDLFMNGHLNAHLRTAVEAGVNPLVALQMVTINAASFLGLEKIIGSISPGKLADLVILKDLNHFKVSSVFYNGNLVFDQNRLLFNFPKTSYPEWAVNTIKLKHTINPEILHAKVSLPDGRYSVRVVGVVPHSVLTESLIEELEVKNGCIYPDITKDILSLSVIERYGVNGNIFNAFIKGFRIQTQPFAMATTVAHDTHNLLVAGTDHETMVKAVDKLVQIKGGYVLATKNQTKEVSLPFAGLMTTKEYSSLYHELLELNKNFRDFTVFEEPLMALSFMALPVIPHLKVTDKGLVDVDQFNFTEVIVQNK